MIATATVVVSPPAIPVTWIGGATRPAACQRVSIHCGGHACGIYHVDTISSVHFVVVIIVVGRPYIVVVANNIVVASVVTDVVVVPSLLPWVAGAVAGAAARSGTS